MIPIKPLFRLLRPHQWLKNSFVFVGLLFGHAWADLARLEQVGWAFAAPATGQWFGETPHGADADGELFRRGFRPGCVQ